MRCSSTWFVLAATLALLVGVAAQSQAAIHVDGGWSDWGIGLSGAGHLVYDAAYGYTGYPAGTRSYNPPPKMILGSKIYYDIEDSDDSAVDSFRLGPLYGGQNYDAEFLGVAVDEDYLYIAIFTGQRPDNGRKRFAPGDIRVQAGGNVYGIEVGGGKGSTLKTDGQIAKGAPGTYYHLDGSGYTTSPYADALTPDQVAGSVWLTDGADWEYGISGSDGVPMQLKKLTGSADGNSEKYFYNYSSGLGQHAFIELSVPVSLFGGEDVDLVSWGPTCGNDYSYLEAQISPPPPVVPEPASFGIWALLVAGAGGCSWWRCSRRRKRGTP